MNLLEAILKGFAKPKRTKTGKASLEYNDKVLPLTERQYNELTKTNKTTQ